MSYITVEHVPGRLLAKIAFVNFYFPFSRQAKVLALSVDYHLFELWQKEIIFDFDLSKSVLKDVVLPPYSYRERTDFDCSNVSQCSEAEQENIQFGKYYAYSGCKKRLIILVKAFDKLVAVERTPDGFKFLMEYSDVDRFEISDPDNNYRAAVSIYFQNVSSPIYETFASSSENEGLSTSTGVVQVHETNSSFQVVSERIGRARTELASQQIKTRRQFIALKDRLMFGPDQVRSDRLEEKQPLGKYGDIWMKIAGDFLVIGMPVVNNCSRRLTILHNVRAAIVLENNADIEYECEVYQLKDDSYQFDNVNELMDGNVEKSNKLTFSRDWHPVKERALRPETSAVVVTKIKLNTILNTMDCIVQCHCFILYEIFNDALGIESFQQYYVRTIEIDTKILCLPEYQISFDPLTTYKDLLAISATSKLFIWSMEYKSECIAKKLSTFLINTFGFSRLAGNDSTDDRMDIDQSIVSLCSQNVILQRKCDESLGDMFYHRPTGHNHLMGTLIRIESHPTKVLLKIYVREDYKALYIYNTLYREFEEACSILPINCYSEGHYQKVNLLNFQESLQKEIDMAIVNVDILCEGGKHTTKPSALYDRQLKMNAQELKTDFILMNIDQF